MLKITRLANGKVVFKLSGRMGAENVGELEVMVSHEKDGHGIVLDLKDLTLVDQGAVSFLERCEADRIQLKKLPSIHPRVDHGRTAMS
jgi:anti-anti-sigma regulatory factor